MTFTEDKLEKAVIELLQAEDIQFVSGKGFFKEPNDVLLQNDLKQYLRSKYAKEQITTAEIDSIIRKLELYPSSALYESNKEIMKLIADGFPLKREDRSKKDLFIQLIDYRLLEKENSTQEDKLALLAAEGMENYKDDQD